MSTNHKPATPLPWHMRSFRSLRSFIEAPKANGMAYGLDVCGDDYTGYGDDEARDANMRYILHACLAYQQLVEEAGVTYQAISALLNGRSDVPPDVLALAQGVTQRIRTLLAELGESA